MAKITLQITDEQSVSRFSKLTKLRKYHKATKTVRTLAEERAQQIEQFGDVPMIPARMTAAGPV